MTATEVSIYNGCNIKSHFTFPVVSASYKIRPNLKIFMIMSTRRFIFFLMKDLLARRKTRLRGSKTHKVCSFTPLYLIDTSSYIVRPQYDDRDKLNTLF